MRNLGIYLLLLVSLVSHAQERDMEVVYDSLWSVWADENNSTEKRIDALESFAWEKYLLTQPDSTIYYCQLGMDLARQPGKEEQLCWLLNNIGVAHAIRGEFDLSVLHYEEMLNLRWEMGDTSNYYGSLANYGRICQEMGDFEKAVEVLEKGRKYSIRIGEEEDECRMSLNVGIAYFELGDYGTAMTRLLRALELAEQPDGPGMKPNILLQISQVYFAQKDYQKAMEYAQKAYASHLTFDLDLQGEARHNTVLGEVFMALGNLDSARVHFRLSYEASLEMGNGRGICESLLASGKSYVMDNQPAEALPYFTRSLDQAQERGGTDLVVRSLIELGNTYVLLSKPEQGIKQGLEAYQQAQKIEAPMLIQDAAQLLAKGYEQQGNASRSLRFWKQFYQIRDSLASEEMQRDILRQEYQYEYDSKTLADSLAFAQQQEIEQVRHKTELQRQSTLRYFLILILLFSILIGALSYRAYQRKKRDNAIIRQQKQLVDIKNLEITDSIAYAKRIQDAMLPTPESLKEQLPGSWVFYQPKDIVSGDFYWVESFENGQGETVTLFAVGDCSGHGVPGAMLTVVCNNALNRAFVEFGCKEPAAILDKTRELVTDSFQYGEEEVDDGMDIALCAWNRKSNTITFAGANNDLLVSRKGEMLVLRADRQPIGRYPVSKPFQNQEIALESGDQLFLLSDGFPDQFGGPSGKKYKSRPLRKYLLAVRALDPAAQKEAVQAEFTRWRGDLEQVDDVCVFGMHFG